MPLPRTDRQIDAAKRAQTARLGQSGAYGKRKRCRKGKSCGASCIHSGKFCLVDLPWATNPLATVRNTIVDRDRPARPRQPQAAPTPVPPIIEEATREVARVIREERTPAPRPETSRPTPAAPRPARQPGAERPERQPMQDNRKISEKLKDKLPDFNISTSPYTGMTLERTIDGNRLRISVTPGGEIIFTVNNKLDVQNLPHGTSVKIGVAVYDAIKELVRVLPQGTKLQVTAYTGDGKGPKRAKAYQRQGFSKADYVGQGQRGKIIDGKIVPITLSEFVNDKTLIEFKERSRARDIADWHMILFGYYPKEGQLSKSSRR